MPHPADKVAVCRGNAPLAGREYSHVPAEAGPASRSEIKAPDLKEHFKKPFLNRLRVYRGGRRYYQHPDVWVYFFALKYFRGNPEVFYPAVRAGTNDNLVNALYCRVPWPVSRLKAGTAPKPGDDLKAVYLDNIRIFRVFVALIEFVFSFGAALYVGKSYFIGRDDSVFSARLNRHIGHGKPVGHRQVLNSRACELHGLIKRAVNAYLANSVEYQVFAADPFTQFAFINEFYCRRNLQPYLARYHGRRKVCRAHAAVENAPRAP